MESVLKRASNSSLNDFDGLCQATTRRGEPCRRKAVDADGLCLVHNGSQDMRELGRKGGRATPKAKRADAQRETLREFLRREVDPARSGPRSRPGWKAETTAIGWRPPSSF